MRSELVEHVSAELGGRVFHALIGGVILVFLTRVLGADSYGILALAVSVFMVSRLFSELGIDSSAARYVAEYKDENPGVANTVVSESKRIAIVTATTVALVLAVASDWIAALLDEPALSSILLLGSGYVLFYSLHEYNRKILQGYGRVATSAKLHAMEAGLTGLLVAAFVLYRPTAVSAVIGYAVGFGFVTLIGFYTVNSVRDRVTNDSIPASEIRNRVLRYNVPLTVTNLSEVVDRQVDVLLIGYFLNPLAVAYYTIGKELSRLVGIPGAAIGFALSPTYGTEKAAGHLERAAAIYEESLKNVLVFYGPACTGIALVAGVLIPNVFGAEYSGAVPVVQILALFVFFEGLAHISSDTLDYLGRARTRAVAKLVTSIGNFGLNVLLIPIIGVEGAAVATVITHGLYSLMTVYLVHVELGFELVPLGQCLARVSAISLIMGLVVYALVQTFSGYVAILVGVGTGTGIWLLGCHALALLDYRQLVAAVRE